MKKYFPIDIPRDGYEMMRFSEQQQNSIQMITDKAEREERWKWAEALPIDLSDNVFWAYWLRKTSKPIKKPLRNCDYLCEAFEPYRKTVFELNGNATKTLDNMTTFSAVGDLMCTKGLDRCQDSLYENVEELIFSSDIKCANLESTFSPGQTKPMEFSSDESPVINLTIEQYKTLTCHKGEKYDIVQLANNHIVDCGEDGALKTIRQLEEDGIKYAGINLSPEDREKTTITFSGNLKIGWLSHTFFVNFRPLPEGKPWFVNITPFYIERDPDLSGILRQIDYCKRQQCDLIIVSLHWGLEFELYPHPQQREWAQIIADAGADIIIGHHPHVIQFCEILHPQSEPEKDVPVIYSLGNLTPVFSSPGTVMSLIARFRIIHENGKACVKKLELHPVVLMKTIEYNQNSMELVELAELVKKSQGTEIVDYVNEISQIADLVLGEDWRDSATKTC